MLYELQGSVGFKKARRGTSFAAQVVGVAAAKVIITSTLKLFTVLLCV